MNWHKGNWRKGSRGAVALLIFVVVAGMAAPWVAAQTPSSTPTPDHMITASPTPDHMMAASPVAGHAATMHAGVPHMPNTGTGGLLAGSARMSRRSLLAGLLAAGVALLLGGVGLARLRRGRVTRRPGG